MRQKYRYSKSAAIRIVAIPAILSATAFVLSMLLFAYFSNLKVQEVETKRDSAYFKQEMNLLKEELILDQTEASIDRIKSIEKNLSNSSKRLCIGLSVIRGPNLNKVKECHGDWDSTKIEDIGYGDSVIAHLSFSTTRVDQLPYLSPDLWKHYLFSVLAALGVLLLLTIDTFKKHIEPMVKKASQDLADQEVFKISRQIVHDIRHPIDTLKDISKNFESLEEETKEVFTSCLNEITDLANELLEQGHKKERISFVPEVVSSVAKQFKMRFKDHKYISILVQPRLEGGFCNLHSNDLKRVISNIVENAIESRKGQFKISISISLKETDNSSILTIRDTGTGIPQDVIGNIFKDGFSYNKRSGNGVGLTFVKKTIDEICGKISIDSNINQGTSFTIELPKEANQLTVSSKIVIDPAFPTRVSVSSSFIKKHIQCLLDQIDPNWNEKGKMGSFNLITDNIDLLKKLGKSSTSVHLISDMKECEKFKDREFRRISPVIVPSLSTKMMSLETRDKNLKDLDMIHVDDSKIIRSIWSRKAKEEGLNLLSLSTPEQLLLYEKSLMKSVTLVLDQNFLPLSEMKGSHLANRLKANGFHNIICSTASDNLAKEEKRHFSYIIGKIPPENLKQRIPQGRG